MIFKNYISAPPGNWNLLYPTSNFRISGITFQSVLQKIRQHETNNNYPAMPRVEIEDRMCRALSNADQQEYCETGIRQRSGVRWEEVKNFLVTVLSWSKTGFTRVSQEEAERRAAICATCPLNTSITGCPLCKSALSEMREQLMKASTSRDAELHACGWCGCDNKTQVHVPLEVLRAGKKNLSDPPAWCWQSQPNNNV